MVEAKVITNYLQSLYSQRNSSSIWVLTLCIFLLTAYVFLSIRRRRYKFPPGPTGVPFFGYLPFLGKVHHETLNKIAEKYGSVFSLFLGRTRVVFLNDWESVKEAFSKNATLDRHPGSDALLPSGFGFAGASGQEWFEQRRSSVKIMKDIGLGRAKWEEMLQLEAEEVVNCLEEHKGHAVDVHQLLSSTFASNIISLVFGERPSDHKQSEYVSDMVDLTMLQIKPMAMASYLPTLCKILGWFHLSEFRDNNEKLKEYDQFMRDCIDKRLKLQGEGDEDSFVKKYNEEMQNKKKSGKTTMTDLSLYANAETLILGGSETTRTSMQWLLIAIAENPQVQSRVHKELDSVLGKDGCIKWADRTKVPFSFACVLEGQRWRTVSPLILPRLTNEDTTIRGYDIPKGTSININNWALHNDPKYWPNPEKYDPTRMLLEGGTQINFKPESFNAFSYGRRSCPGEMIALMAILVYFTKIMQKFKVLPEDGATVKYEAVTGLTHQPYNLKLRFVPRE